MPPIEEKNYVKETSNLTSAEFTAVASPSIHESLESQFTNRNNDYSTNIHTPYFVESEAKTKAENSNVSKIKYVSF